MVSGQLTGSAIVTPVPDDERPDEVHHDVHVPLAIVPLPASRRVRSGNHDGAEACTLRVDRTRLTRQQALVLFVQSSSSDRVDWMISSEADNEPGQ